MCPVIWTHRLVGVGADAIVLFMGERGVQSQWRRKRDLRVDASSLLVI